LRTKTTTTIQYALALALLGCATGQRHRLDRHYGEAAVRDRELARPLAGGVDYETQVRPILEARCVVCHACYDAPCQLKLGSSAGIDRGASTAKVYDGRRLVQAEPTRLFEDADTTASWRTRGFHPVLNERAQNRAANREASLLLQLLELKRAHPLVPGERVPDHVDLRLSHDEKCPTVEEFPRHARKHPDWGMPYGLPGLSPQHSDILTRWVEEGATHRPAPPPAARLLDEVARWEEFLNEDSLAAQLASRYIYEHLFLAHLYFDDGESGATPRFFELVRSRTPPGRAIERIATRRPYDDPGVARPWYRIQPVQEAVVAKLHLPYRLDATRMLRWRALFRAPDVDVSRLPSYAPEVASNPFVAFRALPVRSRYRFMLEEAEFTLMSFIKGAVCRGPIALNVIDDQFWVFFVDPEIDVQLHDAAFLDRSSRALRMPAQASSNARPLRTWLRQGRDEESWAAVKEGALRADFAQRGIGLDVVWDGDGSNANAALTVFRHYDSASVVKGMVGAPPKTAWVIDYPLLERIHYLLVAGFDVFGNAGHQLATRTYMDFLRMEAEFAFLALLPADARASERALWYRGAKTRRYREIVDHLAARGIDTAITYDSDRPKLELYDLLRERMAGVRERRYSIATDELPPDVRTPLQRLAAMRGATLEFLPQTSFVLVSDAPADAQVFTIIRNDGHTNIASLFEEDDRRLPQENTLTVARGLVGAYPNAIYVVERARLATLVDQIAGLADEADYVALQRRFGVRRSDPDFWATLDRVTAISRSLQPIEAGLFDLGRYENR
jgi:hypothetical protein